MTVTINAPERISDGVWRFTWSSDLGGTPTFYLYLDGVLMYPTTETALDIYVSSGESVTLQVFDDAADSPDEIYSGRVTLGWQPIAGVDYYQIEEYVASVWTVRQKISENGSPWYSWRSRYLEDVTVHQFRIIPVGTNGNEGTPATFYVLMVRNPDAPALSFVFDTGTDKITIDAL